MNVTSTFLEPLSLVSWKHALQCLHSVGTTTHRKARSESLGAGALSGGNVENFTFTSPQQDWELNPKLGKENLFLIIGFLNHIFSSL